MAKLKCECSDATVHSGKTPNDTGPDSHHSSKCVRVSGLTEDPPWARIKFPRGNDRNGWDGLDDDLKRDLKKILKRDDSMKSFTDCIYGKCLERYGLVAEKLQKSRRQHELELLKGEKKVLRHRWKSAKEEEKVGLSVLWEELKERVRNLRRAESIRQKNYERRKAHRRFFSDLYRYGKALLDPPKSGELKVNMGELEEHLTNTYSDDFHHIPRQVRWDIPVVPLPVSVFSLASPSLEEVRRVIRKARNRSAPGPNGVPYLLYKRRPKVLYLLHSLIEKAWQSGKVDDEWKVAEGVYIPKERDSHSLSQFRLISLLNVEGKVFFPSLRRGSLNMSCPTSTWIHQSRREAFQEYGKNGVWRKTVNVSSAANPRHSIMCSQITNMPSTPSVHVATQQGPKGNGGSHQNGSSQSKFSQDYVAAEGIFLARGLFTTLQETQTPFEARHSRRGQWLDRRSQVAVGPRRIEALSPIA